MEVTLIIDGVEYECTPVEEPTEPPEEVEPTSVEGTIEQLTAAPNRPQGYPLGEQPMGGNFTIPADMSGSGTKVYRDSFGRSGGTGDNTKVEWENLGNKAGHAAWFELYDKTTKVTYRCNMIIPEDCTWVQFTFLYEGDYAVNIKDDTPRD